MLQVKNKKIIRRLSLRSFLANRTRNVIAIIAIALTTILFTTLFTVIVSINETTQQQTMRMVGGSSHGSFKCLTKQDMMKLLKHPLIMEYGASVVLSTPTQEPFQKRKVELRYGTDEVAKFFFSHPTVGQMPRKSGEIATDTAVLDLLEIPHEVGQSVTITYSMGEEQITDTFILSGYWENDELIPASQVWLDKEYVEEKLQQYPVRKEKLIGAWGLDIRFKNSKKIDENMRTVAIESGYQTEFKHKDNYIDYGVNWAYNSTHVAHSNQVNYIASILGSCLLIMWIGYLIIFNIFSISISKDMQFYGLLKTIGTTKKQMKRLINYQGIVLSIVGIPIGLLIGFLLGNKFTVLIMSNAVFKTAYVSYHARIFLAAGLFSWLTVMISCHKPGKLAGAISPIDAVRYSEGNYRNIKRGEKKGRQGAKVYRMAIANVGRNKKKTTLVIVSLSLSLVLLNSIYALTIGFDLDKFTEKSAVTDFVLGSANYMQSRYYCEEDNVSERFIQEVGKQPGIEETGRGYGSFAITHGYFKKKEILKYFQEDEERVKHTSTVSEELEHLNSEDTTSWFIRLYGLEPLAMKQLKVLEGSIAYHVDQTKSPIIQIIKTDDYGIPLEHQKVKKIGDTMTLRYITKYEYDDNNELIVHESKEKEYQVVANAVMPTNMSYRYFGSMQYAMPAQVFLEDVKKAETMNYLVEVEEEYRIQVEHFIKEFTDRIETSMDYESKALFEKEFKGFRNTFLMIGGGVTVIIGLIGILNFINTIGTSISIRRGEFAMLQSVGMTGKQLRNMLIMEGLMYTICSVIVAMIVFSILGTRILQGVEQVLWFYSYQYVVSPMLLVLPVFAFLGFVIPMISNHFIQKKSIVKRLREVS